MKKLMGLVVLVLALVLTSLPAHAGRRYAYELNAYCQEDADRHGVWLIAGSFTMWTKVQEAKRGVIIWKEYHDYGHITGEDRWYLYRSERDVWRRSVGGVDIYGWFGHGSSYRVTWDPTSYDNKVDIVFRWKGKDGILYERFLPVGEKRDGGPCFEYDAADDPVPPRS
jgi:hypothetical protein